MKDIHDVIKRAKFGDDRLRGSGVVAGEISAFPIDFAGRPYNTLTLPCERVIDTAWKSPWKTGWKGNAKDMEAFRDIRYGIGTHSISMGGYG